MKKLFSLFVVAFMAMSMMAVDWDGIAFAGDGAGGGAYTNKYKFTGESATLVNIQKPGFAEEAGLYVTFGSGISACSLPDGKYAIQGAGIVLYLSAFTAQETQFTVTEAAGTRTCYVYYADGTTGGEEPADGTFTVYYYNSGNWAAPTAHSWVPDGDGTTWPGEAMTAVEGMEGWYSVEVPEARTKIIFSDNGANQTADLTIPSKNRYFAYGEFVRDIRGLGNWYAPKEWTSVDGKIFSFTVTYNAYQQSSFKFHHPTEDIWYGNSGTIDHNADFSTWWDMEGTADIVVRSGAYAGEYTFKYNAETHRFCVVMPTEENRTLTKNGHVITVTPEYFGEKRYKLTITSSETLVGLGGSFWNVNGTSTDMRAEGAYTIDTENNQIICEVTSTQKPNIHTPLYVLMPGEVNFGDLGYIDWIDYSPIATASSGTANLAIDDNIETRWESAHGNDTEWWMVDYRQPKDFNAIQIIWEGAYGKSFEILGSNNGTDWTTITTVTDQTLSGFPNTQVIDLESTVTYQYVKFQGVARGTVYGYSFYEFATMVKQVNVLTSLDFTAAAKICKVGETVALTATPKNQYGEAMEAEVTYSVTPATAGTVAEGVFTAAAKGTAVITATCGELTKSVSIANYDGENVALNKTVTVMEGSGENDEARLVDGNDGTEWQGDPVHGDNKDVTCGFTIDLGAKYDLSLVTIHFEGACSDAYTLETSADNETFALAHSFSGTLGINNHTDNLIGEDLANADGVRYLRFTSTKNSTQWGMKIFELCAYGTATPEPIYFINTGEWENVYCYVRNVAEDPDPNAVGVLATKTERQINGHDVYSFSPAADDLVCRFTDGTIANKSNDQNIQLGRYYTYTASWSAEQVEEVMVSTYLLGTINGEEGFTVKADYKLDETLTKSYNLKAGTYKLKVLDHGEWYGYNGTVTPEVRAVSSTAEFSKSVGEDCTLTLTDLTKVTFAWDATTGEMSFEFDNVDPTTLHFTIVGDEELIGEGHDWDLDYAAYNMTQDAENSYIFTLSVSNVYLRVGNYEYKAAAEHSWDYYLAPATGNNTLEINDNGLFDIVYTLSFETGNPVLTAVATFKEYATGCDEVDATKAQKIVRDGKIVIIKNGVEYSVLGARL